MTPEDERLRAENAGLSKAVIDTQEERDLAQAEFRTYHKAWEEQAARIQELEDALVERSAVAAFLQEAWGSTIQLRAAKAQMKEWERLPEDFKESWRKGVRKQLQAEGKIGPDASKPTDEQVHELSCFNCGKKVSEVTGENDYRDSLMGEIWIDPGQQATRWDPPIDPSYYFKCVDCCIPSWQITDERKAALKRLYGLLVIRYKYSYPDETETLRSMLQEAGQ